MVDLTGHSNKVAALRSNLIENFETSRSTTNLSNIERHPIVTGVSVRALVSILQFWDCRRAGCLNVLHCWVYHTGGERAVLCATVQHLRYDEIWRRFIFIPINFSRGWWSAANFLIKTRNIRAVDNRKTEKKRNVLGAKRRGYLHRAWNIPRAKLPASDISWLD